MVTQLLSNDRVENKLPTVTVPKKVRHQQRQAKDKIQHQQQFIKNRVGEQLYELIEDHFPEQRKSHRRRLAIKMFLVGAAVGVLIRHMVDR